MQTQPQNQKPKISTGLRRKQVIISNIKSQLNKSRSIILFHYHGLDANTINHFRAQSWESKSILKIYKNNLLRIALLDLKLLSEADKEVITGPVACLFSEQNPFSGFATAKELKTAFKKTFKIVYSVFENQVLAPATTNSFINYTNASDIHTKLLWTLKYPLQKCTTILAAIATNKSSAA